MTEPLDQQTPEITKRIGALADALNGMLGMAEMLDALRYVIDSKRSLGHRCPTDEELDSIAVYGDAETEPGSWQDIYRGVTLAAGRFWAYFDDADATLAQVSRKVIDDQSAPLEQRLSARITKALGGVPCAIVQTRYANGKIAWQPFCSIHRDMTGWPDNRALLAECVDRLLAVRGALLGAAVPVVPEPQAGDGGNGGSDGNPEEVDPPNPKKKPGPEPNDYSKPGPGEFDQIRCYLHWRKLKKVADKDRKRVDRKTLAKQLKINKEALDLAIEAEQAIEKRLLSGNEKQTVNRILRKRYETACPKQKTSSTR